MTTGSPTFNDSRVTRAPDALQASSTENVPSFFFPVFAGDGDMKE